MVKETKLTLPQGYVIKEITETLPRERAGELLLTKKTAEIHESDDE